MTPHSPYKWLLHVGLLILLALGYQAWAARMEAKGYARAQAEYTLQAQKANVARESLAAPIALQEQQAQVRVRTVTKTIVEKVPVYVQTNACPLPGGFRLLHDAAATHGKVPDTAHLADAAAVPAQEAARTVVENYGTCHETTARLIGLQSWVSAQQELKE